MNSLILVVLAASTVFLLATGGGVFPWTLSIAAGGITLTQLMCKRTGMTRSPPRLQLLEGIYLAVIAFVLLTMLPLPSSITIVTGRLRHEQNVRAVEAIREASDLGLLPGPSTGFSISRNRAGTLRAGLLIVACFSSIFLASRLTPKNRVRFLYFLSVTGAILAAAGYVALRIKPQGDTLWWIIPIPHGLPGPLLCFVNRNHYAGYLAMLSPATLALFFSAIGRRRFFTAIICLSSFAAMTVAIMLTLSRGAVVAYAAGHAVLFGVYLVRRRWILALCMFMAGGLVITAALMLAPDAFEARMATLRNPISSGEFAERIDASKTCLPIWRSYPLLGAGLNAFRMVFPQHRTTSRREFMVHAENEYAQLLAETGGVGLLLFIGFVLAVFLQRRKNGFDPSDIGLSAGIIACLAAAATHACFDFAPRLPVYAITTAVMIGLLIRQPEVYPVSSSVHASMPGIHQWPAILSLCLVAILSLHVRGMSRMDSPPEMPGLNLSQLSRAIRWSPVSWQAWYYFGRECCRDGKRESQLLGEKCITHASELDPNNYLLWRELGQLRMRLGMREAARAAFARVKQLRFWVAVPEIPAEAE